MLRPLLGLALVGYGLLVLLGLLPHDSSAMAALAVALGAILLAWGLPHVRAPRSAVVAGLGLACVVGVTAYNVLAGSDLGLPELAILGYGMALLAAAPFVHVRRGRLDVASLVGWSFPLLLAPLAVFALDAAVSGDAKAADPVVQALVVTPTAYGLEWTGTPVDQRGSTLVVATPRGTLSLGVGLVCAGLYPMVLFGGVLTLHAWRTRPPARQLLAWLAAGLGGLWLVNLLRLQVLAHVGIREGGSALQSWHANLGWAFFAAFMAVFWAVVLRRSTPPAEPVDRREPPQPSTPSDGARA